MEQLQAERTAGDEGPDGAGDGAQQRDQVLHALGERVRELRARRGLTRRGLASSAEVSERHLANLEYGTGNVSILVLHQIAQSLQCSMAELLGDVTTSSAEWLLIRELLEGRSENELRRVRVAAGELLGTAPSGDLHRHSRIALIGLRGAGKSTLSRMLADDRGVPFIELNNEIETLAGCSVREIYDLYGVSGYRRYERRALEETVQIYADVVIATPGGIVSDPATFNELLSHCTTVWVQAQPEEHMSRVIAQGDTRPMAANPEAMDDLRRILDGRREFYSKADHVLDTSGKTLEQSFAQLKSLVAA
ncbi:helix-turn-helix transcriptional regulator [Diaphorobacter aerolatus]|uniref:Shikimate kinase n=1 Tax=Diaphorobacter aerolatus TaxID=1288495 RepID=A0A7H0GNC9_9BURK|nr:helix-turn-helix transcriptional regulator [Diaphorobacter aerolatus]QNP49795.1 helix-turn-helix transcriptional regulator [Diaphorobacter aerolatus]